MSFNLDFDKLNCIVLQWKKSYPKLCIVCMEFVYCDFIFVTHICLTY